MITAEPVETTPRPTKEDIPNWTVSGEWFDVCNCNIPCPCEFAQAPTYGDCDGILVYKLPTLLSI